MTDKMCWLEVDLQTKFDNYNYKEKTSALNLQEAAFCLIK
jgi:hypothetical protein